MKASFILSTCLLVVLALVLSSADATTTASRPSLKAMLGKTNLVTELNHVGKFLGRARQVHQEKQLTDLTFECALCGIAINEVEGFLIENISLTVMEQTLQKDVCNLVSGLLRDTCDDLVDRLPYVINKLEQSWGVSAVCIDMGFCETPFTPFADPEPVPTYVVNLDLPPLERWDKICSNPTYQKTAQFLVNTVNGLVPNVYELLNQVGEALNAFYFPADLAQEVQGCSQALGIPTGWGSLFNLGYEVSDACTSIVAQTPDGTVLHGRNMDFWAGMGFTDSLKNMTFIADYQKGGKTQFKTTGFAGYVGALSGIKPGGFSVTINSRFYPQGLGELFWEIVAAIEERNASLVSFLSREVLANENNFQAALNALSQTELIADVYYTMAGSKPGEGAVLSRNRHNATNIWMLNSPSRWFEVQTNYDHWQQPPWFDDRVDPADNALNALGQKDITLTGLFNTLSVKPVLNIQTTYTILAVPRNGTYMSWTRWCPFPCVE